MGITGVDDDGLAGRTGELKVPSKALDLALPRHAVPVEVQAGLADGHALGIPRELGQGGQGLGAGAGIFGCTEVVRVDPNGCEDTALLVGEGEGGAGGLEVRADDDHALDARGPCALENLGPVLVEALPVEVGVGVGDHLQCFSTKFARFSWKLVSVSLLRISIRMSQSTASVSGSTSARLTRDLAERRRM